MNLFNRIAVSAICLLLIAASLTVIALAWSSAAESIDGLRDAVDWLEEHNQDVEKAFLTAGAALLALLALVVLVLELIPPRRIEVKVTDLKAGNAVLSTAAIGQRVEEGVSQVPHVADARAVVRSKRKGVQVAMDLHVDPDANLAEVTDAACERAVDLLTNRIHVALAEPPRVRVFYREIRLRRGAPVPPTARPQAAPAAAPARVAAASAGATYSNGPTTPLEDQQSAPTGANEPATDAPDSYPAGDAPQERRSEEP